MATLTSVLTGGNGIPTYNLGIAETYSWIPVTNDQNRPMFARAVYGVNDIVTSKGFTFVDGTSSIQGSFSSLITLSATRLTGLTATDTSIGNIANYSLPANFTISGQIQGFSIAPGAVIAYKS
jgi:hypothetical protein